MKTLKTLRESKNMTLGTLSKITKIPVSSLSLYETGKRKIPLAKADKIAEALGVTKEEIFLPASFAIRKTSKSA